MDNLHQLHSKGAKAGSTVKMKKKKMESGARVTSIELSDNSSKTRSSN